MRCKVEKLFSRVKSGSELGVGLGFQSQSLPAGRSCFVLDGPHRVQRLTDAVKDAGQAASCYGGAAGQPLQAVFHNNGILGTSRMRSVMTEAWSRGCPLFTCNGGFRP